MSLQTLTEMDSDIAQVIIISCLALIRLQCSGTVPSPRSDADSAILDDKVWLYGGLSSTLQNLNDFYMLSMSNVSWTQIQTKGLMPALKKISLNFITDTKLVFRGIPTSEINKLLSSCKTVTWILDVTDMSCGECTASSTDRVYRSGQTCTSALCGSVLIIGGAIGTTFQDPFCIRLEPKCLQQLAMKIIFSHQKTLPWKHLPHKLICTIMSSTQREDIDDIRNGH